MSKNNEPANSFSITSLILSIVMTVIATMAFLHSQDLIKHTDSKGDYVLGELRAVFIEQEKNGQYRLSRKASNLSSACHQGYLFVVSDTQADMQGLVVDYKNRGVKCQTETEHLDHN